MNTPLTLHFTKKRLEITQITNCSQCRGRISTESIMQTVQSGEELSHLHPPLSLLLYLFPCPTSVGSSVIAIAYGLVIYTFGPRRQQSECFKCVFWWNGLSPGFEHIF